MRKCWEGKGRSLCLRICLGKLISSLSKAPFVLVRCVDKGVCIIGVLSPPPLNLKLGPRLTLQLVKIESGLCEGEVLHHEYGEHTNRVKGYVGEWLSRYAG